MISKEDLSHLNKEQLGLSKKVEICSLCNEPRYIAGIDVSYWEADGQEFGVGCLVVYDMLCNKVVHKLNALKTIEFPYITGYLSYREYDIEALALNSCKCNIDVLLVDDNGLLHPRNAGSAVKLGVEFGIPTIGIAKSFINSKEFKHSVPQHYKGSSEDIYFNGKVLGKAVRTNGNKQHLYVSVGNKITLDEAVNIVLKTTEETDYLPIPLRIADCQTRIVRDRYIKVFKEQERQYDPSVLCS